MIARITGGPVKAWSQPVLIRTYEPEPPNRNPMFIEKRVYQGSSGKIYPLPFIDRIASLPKNRMWDALQLVQIIGLPPLTLSASTSIVAPTPPQPDGSVDLSFIVEPKHPRMTGQDRILSRASVFRSEHGHAKGQSRDGEMKAYSHGPFRTGNEFSHDERMRPVGQLYQSWHIAQHIIVIAVAVGTIATVPGSASVCTRAATLATSP